MSVCKIMPKEILSIEDKRLKKDIEQFSIYLNERQRRLYVALEASRIGHGGISKVSKLTGISRVTIRKGIIELNSKSKLPSNKIRRKGGGRKKSEDKMKGLENKLLEIVENDTAGNPTDDDKKWVRKSLKYIRKELNKYGYSISEPTISRVLKKMGLFFKIQQER